MKNSLNIQKFCALMMVVFLSFLAPAQETQVMVRVKAKDAKFIGNSIGGALVKIYDVESGELLTSGITEGTTGNSQTIMKDPHQRRQYLSDEATAGFLSSFDFKEPRLIQIEATAPIRAKQAHIKSSTQLWVIPGKDILGDGIILEIPGFVVDILSPQRHNIYPKSEEIEIKTNVVMMCGCPLTPGGIWDADQYEITAVLQKDGKEVERIKMNYAGKPNTFSGKFKAAAGNYAVLVYAYDAQTGNTGVDQTNIIIQ